MIRVRRSSIRPLHTPDSALASFLSVSLDHESPTRGWAVLRPPAGIDACAQAADHAAHLATDIRAGSVFDFWRQLRDALEHWRSQGEHAPEAAAFGLAVVERALIDACCRAWSIPFAEALRQNAFRIDLGKFYKPLAGRLPRELLPPTAKQLLLHYELSAQGNGETAVIEAGFCAFHIHLTGDVLRDVARLKSLAPRLDPLGRFAVSLDGNGAFSKPEDLRELWEMLRGDSATQKLCRSITHIEQPFPVESSLSNEAVALFAEWPQRPPVLIDEAAAEPGASVRALEWGYAGTIFRAGRGIIPGIADACLLGARREREPVGKWTFAAALTPNLAPALPAELALAGAFGLTSVTAPAELFAPLAEGAPEGWRETLSQECPSIFKTDLGLRQENGAVPLEAVNAAPLGCPAEMESTAAV